MLRGGGKKASAFEGSEREEIPRTRKVWGLDMCVAYSLEVAW